mgnify:CR=1 FL=1
MIPDTCQFTELSQIFHLFMKSQAVEQVGNIHKRDPTSLGVSI